MKSIKPKKVFHIKKSFIEQKTKSNKAKTLYKYKISILFYKITIFFLYFLLVFYISYQINKINMIKPNKLS